jgi:MarR family transcriptional regulator for hemolysin
MSQVASKALPRAGASDEDDLLRLLWELPRLWRAAMDKRLKPLGLSEAKWRTVLMLSRDGDDMSQVELASLLGIEAPSLARLLDRLAKDGWIERRAAANDRRVKTIHLLPKASGVIKKIDTVIFAMRKEALRDISKAEISACAKTLRKIRGRTESESSQQLRAQSMRPHNAKAHHVRTNNVTIVRRVPAQVEKS